MSEAIVRAERDDWKRFAERLEGEIAALWHERNEDVAGRDAARGIATQLEQQLAAIVSLRSCLGAGPMDYELFVDELDEIIRPAAGGVL